MWGGGKIRGIGIRNRNTKHLVKGAVGWFGKYLSNQ